MHRRPYHISEKTKQCINVFDVTNGEMKESLTVFPGVLESYFNLNNVQTTYSENVEELEEMLLELENVDIVYYKANKVVKVIKDHEETDNLV